MAAVSAFALFAYLYLVQEEIKKTSNSTSQSHAIHVQHCTKGRVRFTSQLARSMFSQPPSVMQKYSCDNKKKVAVAKKHRSVCVHEFIFLHLFTEVLILSKQKLRAAQTYCAEFHTVHVNLLQATD